MIGVHFKPGGAPPFFALPLDELCNQHVPLHLLWGTVASELRERLLAAETDRAKLVLLENALLRMLQRRRSVDVAARYALAAFGRGNCRVGDVVNEIGMSQRRFIRLFRDEVGLTPKAFSRIRRFQQAVSMLHRARTVDWADTALACGYCDQSHMIHDFQAIAGLSPTHYFSRRSTHINHVPSPEP